ncbi:uncharacterized protein CXorf38 homolog isoform 3-T3 [Anomaloglossus baeobatrachus]
MAVAPPEGNEEQETELVTADQNSSIRYLPKIGRCLATSLISWRRTRGIRVIKCRNELMHSSDMKVSSSWLKTFGQKMHNLIAEFTHVPGLVWEGERMQKVLLSDWNVKDSDIMEVDGVHLTAQSIDTSLQGPSIISLSPKTVEILMIQEMIQELYLELEEHGPLTNKDLDKVKNMKNFLSQNEDLKSVFQEDIENLDSLCKDHLAIGVEGRIHTRRAAAFFLVVVLAFLIAIFLGRGH